MSTPSEATAPPRYLFVTGRLAEFALRATFDICLH